MFRTVLSARPTALAALLVASAVPAAGAAQQTAPDSVPAAAATQPAPAGAAPIKTRRAVGAGLGWTTSLIGVEYVWCGVPRASHLLLSASAGLFGGPGGRVAVLGAPARAPSNVYVGVGAVTTLYGIRAGSAGSGIRDTRVVPVIDAGVLSWPRKERGLYADLGAGVALFRDRRWVLPRVVIGTAF